MALRMGCILDDIMPGFVCLCNVDESIDVVDITVDVNDF